MLSKISKYQKTYTLFLRSNCQFKNCLSTNVWNTAQIAQTHIIPKQVRFFTEATTPQDDQKQNKQNFYKAKDRRNKSNNEQKQFQKGKSFTYKAQQYRDSIFDKFTYENKQQDYTNFIIKLGQFVKEQKDKMNGEQAATLAALIAKQTSLQFKGDIQKWFPGNKELRIAFHDLIEAIEDHYLSIPISDLQDTTNILSIMHAFDLDNFVPRTYALKTASRVRDLFLKNQSSIVNEQQRQEAQNIPINKLVRICSDIVHVTNIYPVLNHLEEMIQKLTQEEKLNLKMINLIKLLDMISQSAKNKLQSEKFCSIMENLLKDHEVLKLIPIAQLARALRAMAELEYYNIVSHPCIDKIILEIQNKFEHIQEQDVLLILKAYQYIEHSAKGSAQLFNNLNNTVCQSIQENAQNVSISFLLRYLSIFYDLPSSRQYNKAQRQALLVILEEKIKADKGVGYSYSDEISKILWKFPESEVLKNSLIKTLQTSSKKLNFESLILAQKAYLSTKHTQQELKELEKDIMKDFNSSRSANLENFIDWIFFIDTMTIKNEQEQKDFQKKKFQVFEKEYTMRLHKQSANKIIQQSGFILSPSETTQTIVKLLFDHFFNQSQLKPSVLEIIDLIIFIQKNSKNFLNIKIEYYKIYTEYLSNENSGYEIFKSYIKKICRQDKIHPQQSKLILDFMNQNRMIQKVPPFLIYAVIQSMVKHLRYQTENTNHSSFMENLQIEQRLSTLISKIKADRIITPQFFTTFKACKLHMVDLPWFFSIRLRAVLDQEEQQIMQYNQDMLLSQLGIYTHEFHNSLNLQNREKIINYLKSKFSLVRLNQDIVLSIDDQSIEYQIRGLKSVYDIMFQYKDQFEGNENFIDYDQQRLLMSNIYKRINKTFERQIYEPALALYCSLTLFNDKQIQLDTERYSQIKEQLKTIMAALNPRQASIPIISNAYINKDNSQKGLANLILNQFNESYDMKSFEFLQIDKAVKLIGKYAEFQFKDKKLFEKFTNIFRRNEKHLSIREKVNFCSHFSDLGVQSKDIFISAFSSIEQNNSKEKGKVDFEFQDIDLQLFKSLVKVNLHNDQLLDRFLNSISKDFFQQAESDDSLITNHKIQLIHSILAGNLDQKDERFKQLAEKLLEQVNQAFVYLNDETYDIYLMTEVIKNPISQQLSQKVSKIIMEQYKPNDKKKEQIKNIWDLSQVIPALKTLGYTDIQVKPYLTGNESGKFFQPDFYSKQQQFLSHL